MPRAYRFTQGEPALLNMSKHKKDTAHIAKPSVAHESDSSVSGVRFCEGQMLVEVLRQITQDGTEWASRYVTLCFADPVNGWVSLYPSESSAAPYFDFMYEASEPPQKMLAALLEQYPQCSVIDWSRGRLACLEAPGVSVDSLAAIIQQVASLVWGERSQLVDGWYREMDMA